MRNKDRKILIRGHGTLEPDGTVSNVEDGEWYSREEVKHTLAAKDVEYHVRMRERCLLQGCLYGVRIKGKKTSDRCVYCGEKRPPKNRYLGIADRLLRKLRREEEKK